MRTDSGIVMAQVPAESLARADAMPPSHVGASAYGRLRTLPELAPQPELSTAQQRHERRKIGALPVVPWMLTAPGQGGGKGSTHQHSQGIATPTSERAVQLRRDQEDSWRIIASLRRRGRIGPDMPTPSRARIPTKSEYTLHMDLVSSRIEKQSEPRLPARLDDHVISSIRQQLGVPSFRQPSLDEMERQTEPHRQRPNPPF